MPDTRRPATTSQLKRPSSQGLSINGVVPPSRQGLSSAGALNRNAQSRSGEPVMDILAQKLILKMRARFGDAAADIKGQEIISQEVATFMNKATSTGNRLREDDLGLLESAIRIRLSGGTTRPLTMVLEKKAQVEGDEWSKIFQYSISKAGGQEESRA
ncbi:hypothetical protein CEUSTIGMA_g11686.t1 [Chlamydomonas eustigma]|uniref:Uncharacterized protein n=1 Tax=Chlamydomonas eustigma TaxID=1157962 RepID=A0A250XML2_9CHLO|nr:hypothetical protein CEUSTIGMA_g11686.t1 [Chlamydomonas eustigma]|eukprot:GAX84263.1 hypothetical protein CEUSTIGMA_g11686.t1 [Chlamydomonas eustigma]